MADCSQYAVENEVELLANVRASSKPSPTTCEQHARLVTPDASQTRGNDVNEPRLGLTSHTFEALVRALS